MRILLTIAHFYRPVANSLYSSQTESRRADRRAALERALLSWRGNFGEAAELHIETKTMLTTHAAATQLDIFVMVHGQDHLLTPDMQTRFEFEVASVTLNNTMELPFAAHRLIADRRKDYDWFVYAEDDIVAHDAMLFHKLAAFQEPFGPHRVAMPNRFEMNARARRRKVYVDGDFSGGRTRRYTANVDEKQPRLSLPYGRALIPFRRALNPHAGFFALTAEQVAIWTSKPYFMDMDSSFFSALESAATLGLMKTFSIYKAADPWMNFLEIEHVDEKYSIFDWPLNTRSGAPDAAS